MLTDCYFYFVVIVRQNEEEEKVGDSEEMKWRKITTLRESSRGTIDGDSSCGGGQHKAAFSCFPPLSSYSGGGALDPARSMAS